MFTLIAPSLAGSLPSERCFEEYFSRTIFVPLDNDFTIKQCQTIWSILEDVAASLFAEAALCRGRPRPKIDTELRLELLNVTRR